MKKKLKFLLAIFGLLMLCPSINVEAQTYQETFNDKYMWIPGTWVNKTKDGNIWRVYAGCIYGRG